MIKKIVHRLKIKSLSEYLLSVIIILIVLWPFIAWAQCPGAGAGGLPNPLTSCTILEFLTKVVNDILIPIAIPLAAIFIIYPGYMFVTARGDPEKLSLAKKTFMWVVVGTAILLGAAVILRVLENTIATL